jgi:hypothetical protein
MKESPAFLLKQQKEALSALQWYRDASDEKNRYLFFTYRWPPISPYA